jgi:hypothetical protein
MLRSGLEVFSRSVLIRDEAVVPVDERRFQRCVMQTPYFAHAVMRVMAERLCQNGGQLGG